MNMKKLLTFLFALMLMSNFTFGQGNYFAWTGLGDGTSWNQAANWTAPAALPYGEAGGASTYPGQASAGDYAAINNGLFNIITNVPSITLGRLEISYAPGTSAPTFALLSGIVDGDVITMRSPSAEILAENTFWVIKIEEGSFLDLNQLAAPNRLKLVCEPGAHFWQKNNATFFPAEYLDCDGQQGFVLKASAGNHAEFIQQENTSQLVKGWMQYILNDDKYRYFCAPITSVWPAVGDPEFGQLFCRRHNTICVFQGDYFRKFQNGIGWDSWMGNESPCIPNPDVNFETGRGYEYYGKNTNNPGGLYEIYGTFNSQTPSVITLPVTSAGWNLVGNPFPSAITFGEPSGAQTAGAGWSWNFVDIDPIAYYWDNSLNAGAGGYHHYNWLSGVGNGPLLTPDGQGGARRVLARSQGFFVHVVTYGASNITVGNLARVFRGSSLIGKSVIANNMNITLNDASNKPIDDAIINFREDANGTGYDRLMDAYKLFNDITNASQIYFKTTDNVDLASKTLKLENGNTMYPLYLKVTGTGTYSIEASDINTFAATTGISLKDNKANITVDLKVNPVYTFTATAGDDDARFSLYFSDVLGVNNMDNTAFKVYSYDNSIYIQNNELKNANGTVLVYDMIGKQMMQEKLGSDAITRINTNLNTGFYIVSVKTDKGVYNQKVYIN
jgi:hypothetical protein